MNRGNVEAVGMNDLQRKALYKSLADWKSAGGALADVVIDIEALIESLIDAKIKEALGQCCNIEHDWDYDYESRKCSKCGKFERMFITKG